MSVHRLPSTRGYWRFFVPYFPPHPHSTHAVPRLKLERICLPPLRTASPLHANPTPVPANVSYARQQKGGFGTCVEASWHGSRVSVKQLLPPTRTRGAALRVVSAGAASAMRRQVRLLQALRFEFLAPIFGVSIAVLAVVVVLVLVLALVGVLVVIPVLLCSYRCGWYCCGDGGGGGGGSIWVVVVVVVVGCSYFGERGWVPLVSVFARCPHCSPGVGSAHDAATAAIGEEKAGTLFCCLLVSSVWYRFSLFTGNGFSPEES